MPPSSVQPDRPGIVVVLGMHRSGTSLCANLLQALGIDMASEPSPSPENRRGHWERPAINALNDRVLAMFNRGWHQQAHVLSLPEGWWRDPRIGPIQDEIAALLQPMLAWSTPFGFKDPRTARLLPLWHGVFERLGVDPIYVYCIRDPAQVARSVAARDAFHRGQAEYRWLIYNADAIAGVGDKNLCIVPYEDWFGSAGPNIRRLAAFVGAAGRDDAGHLDRIVAALVDAGLRHDDTAPDTVARPICRKLHGAVLECVAAQGFGAPLLEFCAWLRAFEQMVQPLLIETEILRVSVADQNRVIEDLNALIRRLRQENGALRDKRPGAPMRVTEP
jgi:hypothetical protein